MRRENKSLVFVCANLSSTKKRTASRIVSFLKGTAKNKKRVPVFVFGGFSDNMVENWKNALSGINYPEIARESECYVEGLNAISRGEKSQEAEMAFRKTLILELNYLDNIQLNIIGSQNFLVDSANMLLLRKKTELDFPHDVSRNFNFSSDADPFSNMVYYSWRKGIVKMRNPTGVIGRNIDRFVEALSFF